jgi:hypothetical protein
VDAVGVVLIGTGGWLLYAALKGEHPWTMLQAIFGGSSLSTAATAGAKNVPASFGAPETGPGQPLNTQVLENAADPSFIQAEANG